MNSRNSAKRRRQEFQRRLHPVDLRQMECRQRVGTAEHALQLLPKRERPVEHMHFLLQYGSQLRELAAPFHDGGCNEADRENSPGACRRHDQDGRDRARNPITLQEARRRRQHGADDEGHRDRQKEGPRKIEADDHNDDQQGDQRKGHDFRAADHRRQFTLAVGERRAFRLVRKLAFAGRRFFRRRFVGRGLGRRGLGGHGLGGSDAHNGFPPPETAMTRQKHRRRRAELWRPNAVGGHKFHRGSVSVSVLDRMRRSAGRTELPAPGGVCWCRASNDAHIQRGSTMTQSIDRRPSSRAAHAARSRQRRFAGAGGIFQRRERADARLRFHPAERVPADCFSRR